MHIHVYKVIERDLGRYIRLIIEPLLSWEREGKLGWWSRGSLSALFGFVFTY